jgi:hypothetical protein
MTPLLTHPEQAPPRSRVGVAAAAVVAAAGGVALFFLLTPILRSPPSVDAVTISNPHPWHVEVEVGPPDGSRWIGLGHVGREQTRTFGGVLDAGGQWVFHFAYVGIESVSVTVPRVELERAAWTVRVPDEFAARLRAAGVSPTAPS